MHLVSTVAAVTCS